MTAVDLDTDTIAALEFSPTIPCEHSNHRTKHAGDEPAAWAVISLCPHCQRVARFHLCEPGRRLMATGVVGCVACHGTGDWAAFAVRVEPIGGAS